MHVGVQVTLLTKVLPKKKKTALGCWPMAMASETSKEDLQLICSVRLAVASS